MTMSRLTLAAAASLLLSTPLLTAQAKPSPYEGVSTPPASDSINTTEQAPAVAPAPAAVAPAPAAAPAPAPAAKTNPDAGIIETPLPASAGDYMPHRDGLHPRNHDGSADKDDDIVTYVPGPSNALPEGTVFKVRMLQDIDAGSTTANTPFRGTVAEDVLRNGKVVIPVGSEVRGRVVYAAAGNRLNGGSVIHLRPDEFVLPDGTRYHMHAQVIDTVGSDTRVKGEGNISANEHGKRSLAEGSRWRSDHRRRRWGWCRCSGWHGRRCRGDDGALAANELVSESACPVDGDLQPDRSDVSKPDARPEN